MLNKKIEQSFSVTLDGELDDKLATEIEKLINDREKYNENDHKEKLDKFVKKIEDDIFKVYYKDDKNKDDDDEERIRLFWKLIDIKILNDQLKENIEYNFSNYYFPTNVKKDKNTESDHSMIEESFRILTKDKIVFDKETIFLKCVFTGNFYTKNCVFKKKVNFNLAKFKEEIVFKSGRFEDETYFRKTYFEHSSDFEACFFHKVNFDEVTLPDNTFDNFDDKKKSDKEKENKFKVFIDKFIPSIMLCIFLMNIVFISWLLCNVSDLFKEKGYNNIIILIFLFLIIMYGIVLLSNSAKKLFLYAIWKKSKKNFNMDRCTFDTIIWTDFINHNDVTKINANRETFATLKEENSKRGNFIDSNLFFVAESDAYLEKSLKRMVSYDYEDDNLKPPRKFINRLFILKDIISFLLAKITNNYGTDWVLPLFWIVSLILILSSNFKANKDFRATEYTPKFLLEKLDEEQKPKLDEYYRQYNYYNFEFSGNTKNYKLKDSFETSVAYLINSSYPEFITKEKWFVTIGENKNNTIYKILISIIFVYLIGAFIFAVKNRTRRD